MSFSCCCVCLVLVCGCGGGIRVGNRGGYKLFERKRTVGGYTDMELLTCVPVCRLGGGMVFGELEWEGAGALRQRR